MDEWNKLIEKNKDLDEYQQWAFPVSEGQYLPTPLSSLEMAMAVEADAYIQRLPGTEYSLFPPDRWTFLVHGDDDYALGWIAYLHYRYANTLGWTSYSGLLNNIPHINQNRIAQLVDPDAPERVEEVKKSNPHGVKVVIQTDSNDTLDKVALPCLEKGGDLYWITTLPVSQGTIKALANCFKEIKLLRAYWTTPVAFPIVVVACIEFSGDAADFLKPKKTVPSSVIEEEKTIIKDIINQQKYIASLPKKAKLNETSSMFLKFLSEAFPTWNI